MIIRSARIGINRNVRASLGRELSPREARSFFHRQVKLSLGIPGAEFIRRFEKGKYKRNASFKISRLAALIPLARQ
jgi:hypothetical protein